MSRKQRNFRRCHVCGATNESENEEKIVKCHGCGKAFAPFFYFDVKDIEGFSVDGVDGQTQDLKLQLNIQFIKELGSYDEDSKKTSYQPLRGLSAIWTSKS